MDSFLAFSILSSSPADIAAHGGYGSTRLSWRTSGSGGAKQQQQHESEKKAPIKQQDKLAEKQQPQQVPGERKKKQQEARPRFAPEFDGLNCFESVVPF